MRIQNILKFRHFFNRGSFFIIGVVVGFQLYGMLWPHLRSPMTATQESMYSNGPLRELMNQRTTTVSPELKDEDILNLNASNKEFTLEKLVTLNTVQKVRNSDKFPLKFRNDSVVILIQVHKRTEDLGILIESLRGVRYINESLVVFSHDYFSREIFELVQSIDFCPVMQIFYPFSIQFLNDTFPGDLPGDCRRDEGVAKANVTKCYNYKYPDSYGHYREAKYTQIKHHWLWKQQFLFDEVTILKDFNGVVLRLDDDYYLAEDTIHVLRLLDSSRVSKCPKCLMYILGEHETIKAHTYTSETDKALQTNYYTGIGRGMAFRREFWNVFKSCAKSFCKFDDYNWDWSLEHSSNWCFKVLEVFRLKAGRIFHIGTCQGFHRNVKNCDKNKVKSKIMSVLSQFKNKFFPKTLSFSSVRSKIRPSMRGYGGWADPRDQELCFKIFANETHGDRILENINKIISL